MRRPSPPRPGSAVQKAIYVLAALVALAGALTAGPPGGLVWAGAVLVAVIALKVRWRKGG